MRGIAIAITGAAAGLVLTGCGSSAPAPIRSHGVVTVFASPDDGETVQDAYPDIATGGQVTIVDSSGKVVATGTLTYNPQQTASMLTKATAGTAMPASDLTTFIADYDFTVSVPGGLARYGIKVGQNRGTIYETASQMKHPALTLGSLTG